MKKILFLMGFVAMSLVSMAGFVERMPIVRIQPNGDTLHMFVTGDEYYHRFHDADDFTIVQNPRNGYWVYATQEAGELVPTGWVAGSVDPMAMGLTKGLGISRAEWQKLQHRYDIPAQYQHSSPKTGNVNRGTINNLVIFVRFSDETELTTSFSTVNSMFNDSSANANSMYAYFQEASYGQLYLPTYYAPSPTSNNTIVSVQDIYPRSYYEPYDATSNTNGYSTDSQRSSREFSLWERTINYINNNCPISSSINLDYDNDGYIDNIVFVVKGTYTGWNDLLWPHKWAIYDRYVYINGKRAYTFNLQLEGSGSHYFSSSTLCHEMFHTLGAPDLYRYYVGTDVSTVGSWDLMCSNTTPPQHTSAYMKFKYGNWIDSIPEITVSGTYSLRSIADQGNVNNCYKIAAQEPHQWYVLEYRDNDERFETALPGKGLLIFRVDDRYNGNASYDGTSTYDEYYLFRPNGNNDSTNGSVAAAYFSGNTSRTSFTPTTNPYPWCTHNIIDTTFSITNIGIPGDSIVFTYNDLRGCRIPDGLTANPAGISADLSWEGNGNQYILRIGAQGQPMSEMAVSGTSLVKGGLQLSTTYQWQVRSICGGIDTSDWSELATFTTLSCFNSSTTEFATAATTSYYVPCNVYYKYGYTQQIYLASELDGPMEITTIRFNYQSNSTMSNKEDCIMYLGHTTQQSFTGSDVSNFVPFNQLHQVWSGSLNCVNGWNDFVLDSTFNYNGTDNLVIAIVDNSGAYDNSSCTFVCNQSSAYRTLSYYSDSYSFDPSTDNSYSGSKYRRYQRNDIQLVGCGVDTAGIPQYQLTVLNANPEMGSTTADSLYDYMSEVSVEAYPAEHYHFTYWTLGEDTITFNPYLFAITDNTTITAHFAIDQHQLVVRSSDETMGSAWAIEEGDMTETMHTSSSFDYGTVLTLYATPNEGYRFLHWNDGNTDATRSITLLEDSEYTALFSNSVGVEESADGGIVVLCGNRQIQVSGLQGRNVQLYDVEGRLLSVRQGDNATFKVDHVGLYILKIEGENAYKVVVK